MESEKTHNPTKRLFVTLGIMGIVVFFIYCLNNILLAQSRAEYTKAKVREICSRLDAQTDVCGVYIQVSEVSDKDAWGNLLRITYSRGGLTESVEVRSSGKDGVFFSNDDIFSCETTLNFAGVANGVIKGASLMQSALEKK